MVVNVAILDPFVFENNDGTLGGFDIELWNEVSRVAGLNSKIKKVAFKEIFDNIELGTADIGIAGISITNKREQKFDFSYPYLDSGLQIMVRSDKQFNASAAINSFTKTKVLRSFGYLLIFIFICGHIVWYAERGQDAISDNYFQGILESFWWAFVTMTTVGYGDIAPKKWVGRIVAVVVMFTGIMFFGWFIAVISNSIEYESLASRITSTLDLRGALVATKRNSTSVASLQKLGATVVPFSTIENAANALKQEKVVAVVFDKPVLDSFILNKSHAGYTLTGDVFNPQKYGFILKEGSLLREKINLALLETIENGTYTRLQQKYFGN